MSSFNSVKIVAQEKLIKKNQDLNEKLVEVCSKILFFSS